MGVAQSVRCTDPPDFVAGSSKRRDAELCEISSQIRISRLRRRKCAKHNKAPNNIQKLETNHKS